MKLRSGSVMTEEESTTSNSDIKKSHNEISIFGHVMNKVIFVVHVNIVIYAACFFIQVGTLPYLSKKLGVDPVMFGYLQTLFAVVQLAGGPLYGRFGDIYGGQAALVLAFTSAACSYGLLVAAVTIPILFMSRLPSVFMHAMQGGQMVVTDMASSNLRADALGKLGISYGIGMVIGPFVGGLVTQYAGEVAAAALACSGSIISVLMCLYLVPTHTKSTTHVEDGSRDKAAPTTIFDVKKLAALLNNKTTAILLGIRMVSGIPIGIFQSMFSVVAIDTFNLEPEQNGYILSYVGVLSMITQGLVIRYLLKKTSEMNIIKIASIILVVAYLMLAYVTSVWQLVVVLIPMCVGLTLMSVVISSALTHTVADTDTGAMLGMNMAVNSLIRTVSPTVGGIMLARYGFSSIGYLGFLNSLLITGFMMVKHMK